MHPRVLCLLLLASPAPSFAADATASDSLQLAPPTAVDQSVRKLAGHTVYGPKGDRIGVIKDFVIEKQTGRVVYAVVSTGGVLGVGDALKLIPIHALLAAPTGATGFSIRVSQADWQRVPAVITEAFDHGLVIVSADHQRLHDQLFGPPPTPAPRTQAPLPLDRAAALAASPWVRATQLRGHTLRSGADTIGRVDDVVIDLRRATALALVDVDDALLPGDRHALVPLAEFTHPETRRGQLATHFTRQDFVRLDPAARAHAEASLLPTGRAGGTPAMSPDATLASAARSARQALDQEPTLARADIQVLVEGGALVLRGRVPTEKIRERAAAAVHDAASGIRLRNELALEPR